MRPLDQSALPLGVIVRDVMVGDRVVVSPFTNLYGCILHDDVFVGPFVEIQNDAEVGVRSRVSSHSFICAGCMIGPDVFVGHGVMTCNDRLPFIGNEDVRKVEPPTILAGCFVGSGAVILPGVTIGERARIGAGATVSHDVDPGDTIISSAGTSLTDVDALTSEGRAWRAQTWPLRSEDERLA